ncbi:hypothetical protein [Alienimonas californiensis]|uniref:Carboxypeptidase regulatory-like domain-containing protein n=1 Tax=Alienimonas californiensis TaxID=2527989 RepID=A0A517P719_9PLAN|nr:hypothetical protein [Alienimonas californiensis]QDT15170.1 hypothetical protein CA12_12510 [Alienimonas californiensis]
MRIRPLRIKFSGRLEPLLAPRTPAAGIAPSAVVALAAALAALLAAGCGGSDRPPQVAVRGTVTVDGAPLPAGTVTFVPVEGAPGPRTSAAIAGGEYAVPAAVGPVPGAYRVEIVSADPDRPPGDAELSPAELARLRSARPSRPWPLPAVYHVRSTLRRDVTAEGENRFDFPLTRTP